MENNDNTNSNEVDSKTGNLEQPEDKEAQNSGDNEEEVESSNFELKNLTPPQSSGEKVRDSILRVLDRPIFQGIGMFVLFIVIADGALFFFLLMGWQTLCRPRTDCEPRNWWYNFSIQVLNVCFTYMVTVSMPWRCTNFLHICGWGCPRRENRPGHNLYGMPTNEVWFHVPLKKRGGITLILIWNCLTQYANQATRIKYYNFDLQNEYPGNLWTNIFFGLSFLLAGIGAAWMAVEVLRLHKQNPEQFGPGPVVAAKAMFRQYVLRQPPPSTEEGDIPNGNGDGEPHTQQVRRDSQTPEVDPTREPRRRTLVGADRASMRMWAM